MSASRAATLKLTMDQHMHKNAALSVDYLNLYMPNDHEIEKVNNEKTRHLRTA